MVTVFVPASEGLDKREADTCILATPKGRITQCVGRIQRPCATKQTPIVLDVVDTPGVFQRLRWKRQREYSREGYRVQVVRTDDPSVDWFV
jgi:superfamily II DNA or RNA helicase